VLLLCYMMFHASIREDGGDISCFECLIIMILTVEQMFLRLLENKV
jgi:hypothetical protein